MNFHGMVYIDDILDTAFMTTSACHPFILVNDISIGRKWVKFIFTRALFVRSLTREHVKASLSVLRWVSIARVADDHAGLPHSSVPDQHTADDPGLQLVLPGQPASRGDSGLVVEVIHVRWHVETHRFGKSRRPSSDLCEIGIPRVSCCVIPGARSLNSVWLLVL